VRQKVAEDGGKFHQELKDLLLTGEQIKKNKSFALL
jgi:hypothetical protein